MNLRTTFCAVSIAVCLTMTAGATVTLNMSSPFSGEIASNFANAAGVPTTGMNWGIIVDTLGDGFDSGAGVYDFLAAGVSTAATLNVNSVATDDFFIPSANLTTDSSALQENDFTTFGAPGTITQIASITLGGANNVTTGDSFALIWFGNNTSAVNDPYGFYTHASFTLPADGGTVDMSSPFGGVDPIRSASSNFGPAVIPEPSRVVLLGLGALGIFARRRRS